MLSPKYDFARMPLPSPAPPPPPDVRETLWAAVSALMRHHWGRENLSRLAAEVDLGPGTATRIKQQRTSVGIDIVARIAEHFGVQAWQLLVPHFDPGQPPTLMAMSEAERQLWARLAKIAKDMQPPPQRPAGAR